MNTDLISLTPSIEPDELTDLQAFTKVDWNGERILEARLSLHSGEGHGIDRSEDGEL